jgi:sulfhydrogenase subunit beta (sulfur reductase)
MDGEIGNRFDDIKRYFFDYATLEKFIVYLMSKAKVIAPHQKGEKSYSFEEVTAAQNVVLIYPRTIQPLKKYFLPPEETILTFDTQKNQYTKEKIKVEKRIFFAIHSYELQSIKRLDYAFAKGHPESNYLTRRENSLFIGISFTPDKWHFSKSVGIEIEDIDGFCLYFEPLENGFLVFEINEDGKDLMTGFGAGVEINAPLNIELFEKNFQAKIKYHYNRLPQIFDHVYKSKVWEEVAKRCVGCGTCNLLCPTCYCFDVRDEIELNIREGKRQRFWDGCMLNPFAEVAGGENFREKLNARTRHRLYRKFKYITDLTGQLQCVGCGRCTRYCPADINLVEIINNLIEDYDNRSTT